MSLKNCRNNRIRLYKKALRLRIIMSSDKDWCFEAVVFLRAYLRLCDYIIHPEFCLYSHLERIYRFFFWTLSFDMKSNLKKKTKQKKIYPRRQTAQREYMCIGEPVHICIHMCLTSRAQFDRYLSASDKLRVKDNKPCLSFRTAELSRIDYSFYCMYALHGYGCLHE